MTNGLWVIDASVLAKVFLKDEDHASIAEEIVRQFVTASIELVAPQLILYEIPSAIETAVRRQRLDANDARQAIRDFFDLGIPTLGDGDALQRMIDSAYMRAAQLGCRLYDALYLIVAEALDGQFITADEELYDAVKDQLPYVVWIGDYVEKTGRTP
ncbi:MAG: type II toxin-antitoxin system VapC family toxin [Chloroflexi bacterium]|nr:type II toxin-antitoxin system VapC family toxin [Chloroflexota bacterium]